MRKREYQCLIWEWRCFHVAAFTQKALAKKFPSFLQFGYAG
jgi:hypothetical protein